LQSLTIRRRFSGATSVPLTISSCHAFYLLGTVLAPSRNGSSPPLGGSRSRESTLLQRPTFLPSLKELFFYRQPLWSCAVGGLICFRSLDGGVPPFALRPFGSSFREYPLILYCATRAISFLEAWVGNVIHFFPLGVVSLRPIPSLSPHAIFWVA